MSDFSARTRRALRCAVVEPLEDRLLMARIAGVDVSGNQSLTAANWVNLKSAGYTFAWTKATEGYTFNDSTLGANMTNAKNAGVLIGAYHFARYDNQKGIAGADLEAGHFWGQISSYVVADGKHLVPVLDLENTETNTPSSAGYTATTLSQWAVEFLTDIKNDAAAAGITLTPVIYTGAFLRGHLARCDRLPNRSPSGWPTTTANRATPEAPITTAPSPRGKVPTAGSSGNIRARKAFPVSAPSMPTSSRAVHTTSTITLSAPRRGGRSIAA